MSDQDYEGLDDLYEAMRKAAKQGHPGDNAGRIFDGCLFITRKEWGLIPGADGPASKTWDDMDAVEKLACHPIRIIDNGESEELSDGRVLIAFADTLYLLPKTDQVIPPLPRLHVAGRYV